MIRQRTTQILALCAVSLLGVSTLLGQGSGSTSKATAKTTQKSTYQTVHHVNGVVTARTDQAVTVQQGSKTRKFAITKGTRFVGTRAAKGAAIKISYRSSAPGVAFEIRSRS